MPGRVVDALDFQCFEGAMIVVVRLVAILTTKLVCLVVAIKSCSSGRL